MGDIFKRINLNLSQLAASMYSKDAKRASLSIPNANIYLDGETAKPMQISIMVFENCHTLFFQKNTLTSTTTYKK